MSSREQEPKKRGCPPRIFTKDDEDKIFLIIQDNPSITLEGIKAMLNKDCSISAVHRTLHRLGLTYKKKLCGLQSKIGKMSKKHVKTGLNGVPHARQTRLYLLMNLQQRQICVLCMAVPRVVRDAMHQLQDPGKRRQCLHLSGLMGKQSALYLMVL